MDPRLKRHIGRALLWPMAAMLHHCDMPRSAAGAEDGSRDHGAVCPAKSKVL